MTTATATNSTAQQLSEKHLAKLTQEHGLSPATIDAMGVYTTNDDRHIQKLLGRTAWHAAWNEVLILPYHHAEGYVRARPDYPRHGTNGKHVKYESAINKPVRAYFPPGFPELNTTSTTIIITEGELKAAKVQQDMTLPCIGLGGVWNAFKRRPKTEEGRSFGKRILIDDLEPIGWKGREVVIVFDSDAATNAQVQQAEWALASALIKKGAVVRVARIPEDGENKVGADDFLVKHGLDAFKKLLDAAEVAEKPPAPKPMELARSFLTERHSTGDVPTIRHWRDEFHAYTGTHYRPVPDAEVDAELLQWLDLTGLDALPRTAADVRKCLASEVHISFAIDQPVHLSIRRETTCRWLAMRNGLISLDDVVSGRPVQVQPHTPLWFSPFALPYDFVPNAECPTWFQTLDSIFDGDEERVNMLAEWFGYCLTADTSQHGILFLEGPPRSGKGTILRTMAAVIGSENVVSPSLTSLSDTFGLWPLVGKQLAICPDAHLGHGDKALAVLERLKSISGEDSVDIHRKHMRSLNSVRLGVRFALGVNDLPKFGDSAGALGPRVHILPCRNSFVGREDRQLEGKLAAELPAIFLWAIDGLRRLQDQGRFTKPEASKEVEADFARLVSPLRAFVEECCDVGPAKEVSREALWEAWKQWTEANGHKAGSRELLGARLRSLVPDLDTAHPRSNGSRTRIYIGIALRSGVSN